MLSDAGLMEALCGHSIGCVPWPTQGQVQPASIDLRLSRWIRIMEQRSGPLDPFDESTYGGTELIEVKDSFDLWPGNFVLGSTIESISLDNRHAGRIEGKSSLGRLGLEIHSTAGFIDPGFSGHPTLEITNKLRRPVVLTPGMFVCQLAVYPLDQPCEHDYSTSGKYSNQGEKPQASLYWKNQRPA